MMLHVVDEIAALMLYGGGLGAGGTIQMRVGGENECMLYGC